MHVLPETAVLNLLMDQYWKEEANQSVESYEESAFSGKDNSSYSQHVAHWEPCISYRSSEWLIRLIQLNPHKMRQVVEWITALLTLLRQQPAPCPQSISSLNFEALQPNQQRYFVFVEDYHRFFYQLKVLDENGQILSFKIEENSQKQPCLSATLKRLGRKMPVFLFDYTDQLAYLHHIIDTLNPSNLIVVIREPHLLSLSKTTKWISFKKVVNEGRFRYYYNSRKKIANISEDIDRIISVEAESFVKLRTLLSESNLAPLSTMESHYLILNMALSIDEPLNASKISSILSEGLLGVQAHRQRWEQMENSHFPGSGQAKKGSCSQCRRKKSEVVCRGCSFVYGKDVNLCIGECFHKFHEERSMFMKKEKTEVCKDIAFFDRKCREIAGGMDQLIEGERPEYLQFIDYLQARLLHTVNKLLLRQCAIDDDQVDTNQ